VGMEESIIVIVIGYEKALFVVVIEEIEMRLVKGLLKWNVTKIVIMV
jgi:hypothetical protein